MFLDDSEWVSDEEAESLYGMILQGLKIDC